MRAIFREGDLVSAEVQALHQEGGVALQTRTLKFGRLLAGQLVTVAPSLVKRQKQHFVAMQEIGGRRRRCCCWLAGRRRCCASPAGCCWSTRPSPSPCLRPPAPCPIAPPPGPITRPNTTHPHPPAPAGVELILGVNGMVWVAPYVQRRDDGSLPDPLPAFGAEARQAVVRVAGAIRALAQLHLMVYPAAISETCVERPLPACPLACTPGCLPFATAAAAAAAAPALPPDPPGPLTSLRHPTPCAQLRAVPAPGRLRARHGAGGLPGGADRQ
jgi:hypothetical protein